MRSSTDLISDRYGEKALKDIKENRSVEDRLANIETELQMLTSAVDLEVHNIMNYNLHVRVHFLVTMHSESVTRFASCLLHRRASWKLAAQTVAYRMHAKRLGLI